MTATEKIDLLRTLVPFAIALVSLLGAVLTAKVTAARVRHVVRTELKPLAAHVAHLEGRVITLEQVRRAPGLAAVKVDR